MTFPEFRKFSKIFFLFAPAKNKNKFARAGRPNASAVIRAGEQSMSKPYADHGTPCTARARIPDRWDRHRQRQAAAWCAGSDPLSTPAYRIAHTHGLRHLRHRRGIGADGAHRSRAQSPCLSGDQRRRHALGRGREVSRAGRTGDTA